MTYLVENLAERRLEKKIAISEEPDAKFKSPGPGQVPYIPNPMPNKREPIISDGVRAVSEGKL